MRRAAWGVDLTGGGVRAVRLERRGARYRIVDVVDQPCSAPNEGAEPLTAHLPDSVGRALTDLLQARRTTLGDPIFVSMPTFGARQGTIEVPVTDPARVPALVDFELHQHLGGDLEPWLVRTSEPVREGHGVRVDWFAHRRELVLAFVADLQRFGVPYDALVASPLALARYLDLEWPASGRRLAIELHRTRIDLLFSSPKGPRWRSLPFGSGVLPEPVGGAKPASVDLERLADRIAREHREARVAFFGALDGTAPERIVLLGDGARHVELKPLLQERLGGEITVPHAPKHFDVRASLDGATREHVLHFGTAIGLALAALSDRGASESLVALPAGRRAARRLPALAAALLLLAVGLLATGFVAERVLAKEQQALAKLEDAVHWSAEEDWNETVAAARAADARLEPVLAKARRTRAALELPRRLLQSIADAGAPFRLVALETKPTEHGDEATLSLEVFRGQSSASDSVRAHLERHAGLTVLEVAAQPPKEGVTRVDARVALGGRH